MPAPARPRRLGRPGRRPRTPSRRRGGRAGVRSSASPGLGACTSGGAECPVFVHHNRAMQVFLETERLLLRRFTEDDLENLVELDSDPEVMRFITGGRATPREEVANEILPAFLDHYERYAGYGFWAAVEKSTEGFLGWFHFRDRKSTRLNSSHTDISR